MSQRLNKPETVFKAVCLCIYILIAAFSVIYALICLAYGGIKLTFLWFWPCVTAFCLVRIWMLVHELKKKERLNIPKAVRWAYYALFALCLAFFVFVESRIIGAMTAPDTPNLEYVIVLGAGLRGKVPKNPLKTRISKAAEYAKANPDTKIIASGGQGEDEEISEAECIRQWLTQQYDIDNDRIILEESSTDTEENLKYCLEIIKDPNTPVGIISNGFHEYRAMMIADHTGYKNAHPIPSKTLFPVGPHYTVREFFGVVELMIKYRQ